MCSGTVRAKGSSHAGVLLRRRFSARGDFLPDVGVSELISIQSVYMGTGDHSSGIQGTLWWTNTQRREREAYDEISSRDPRNKLR
jgi:hypothetical protein